MRAYALLIPMLYTDILTDAMTKGLGQQKVCVRYNIFTSFLDVVFLYLLLPVFGMQGYYISFLVTHVINFVLSLRRLLKITIHRISLRIPFFSAVAMAFGIWAAFHVPNAVAGSVCYLLILGCLLFLFGILGREDIRWMKGLVYKK